MNELGGIYADLGLSAEELDLLARTLIQGAF